MLADLLVLFGAVGFPALHLDDQLVNRFFQGDHTVIKLVQEKADDRYCNDLDDVKDILEVSSRLLVMPGNMSWWIY